MFIDQFRSGNINRWNVYIAVNANAIPYVINSSLETFQLTKGRRRFYTKMLSYENMGERLPFSWTHSAHSSILSTGDINLVQSDNELPDLNNRSSKKYVAMKFITETYALHFQDRQAWQKWHHSLQLLPQERTYTCTPGKKKTFYSITFKIKSDYLEKL